MAAFSFNPLKISFLRNAIKRLTRSPTVFHFLSPEVATFFAKQWLDDPLDRMSFLMLVNNKPDICQYLSNEKLQEMHEWLPLQLKNLVNPELQKRKLEVPSFSTAEQAIIEKYKRPAPEATDENAAIEFFKVLLEKTLAIDKRLAILAKLESRFLIQLIDLLPAAEQQLSLGQVLFERQEFAAAYTCFIHYEQIIPANPRVKNYCKKILLQQLSISQLNYDKLNSLETRIDSLAKPIDFTPHHFGAIKSLYEEIYKEYNDKDKYCSQKSAFQSPPSWQHLLDAIKKVLAIEFSLSVSNRLTLDKNKKGASLAEVKRAYYRLGLAHEYQHTKDTLILKKLDAELRQAIVHPEICNGDAGLLALIYEELNLTDYYEIKRCEFNFQRISYLLGDRRYGDKNKPEENCLNSTNLQENLAAFHTPLDKLKALEATFTFIKTTKDLYTRRNNICLFFLKALRTDDSAINQTKKAQLGTLKQAYLQITRQALKDKTISLKQKQAIIKLAQLSPLIDFNTSYYDDRKNHPTSSRNTLNPMLYDAAKRLSV